jgi:hypothetical protein
MIEYGGDVPYWKRVDDMLSRAGNCCDALKSMTSLIHQEYYRVFPPGNGLVGP